MSQKVPTLKLSVTLSNLNRFSNVCTNRERVKFATKLIPPVNYVLQKSPRAKPFVVHADKLKKCFNPPTMTWPVDTEGEASMTENTAATSTRSHVWDPRSSQEMAQVLPVRQVVLRYIWQRNIISHSSDLFRTAGFSSRSVSYTHLTLPTNREV